MIIKNFIKDKEIYHLNIHSWLNFMMTLHEKTSSLGHLETILVSLRIGLKMLTNLYVFVGYNECAFHAYVALKVLRL